MYLPIEPQPSSARAWLAAACAVHAAGGDAHNVIIDITNPLTEDSVDSDITRAVDHFLRAHNAYSLSTVANTVFPASTLRRHGPKNFYSVYLDRILPRMKRRTRDWGRYFERMTKWQKASNNAVTFINPLSQLTDCMRRQVEARPTYRNVYEMTIYDPTRDAGKVSNRQCLSFLSFKLTDDNHLLLTAIYRNHAYIARGLGNFIGLARLQRFVAQEARLEPGSLTCISTHAEIDHGRQHRNGIMKGWTKTQATEIITACQNLLP